MEQNEWDGGLFEQETLFVLLFYEYLQRTYWSWVALVKYMTDIYAYNFSYEGWLLPFSKLLAQPPLHHFLGWKLQTIVSHSFLHRFPRFFK